MPKWLFQFSDLDEAQAMGFGCLLVIARRDRFEATGGLDDEHTRDEIIVDTGVGELEVLLDEIAESTFGSHLSEGLLRERLVASGHFEEATLFPTNAGEDFA